MGFQKRKTASGTEILVQKDLGPEQLSIPAYSFNTVPGLSQIPPPRNEEDVKAWVSRLATTTAATLLHLVDPLTQTYSYTNVVGKNAKREASDLCWQSISTEDDESEQPTKSLKRLVIEVKDPCMFLCI